MYEVLLATKNQIKILPIHLIRKASKLQKRLFTDYKNGKFGPVLMHTGKPFKKGHMDFHLIMHEASTVSVLKKCLQQENRQWLMLNADSLQFSGFVINRDVGCRRKIDIKFNRGERLCQVISG